MAKLSKKECEIIDGFFFAISGIAASGDLTDKQVLNIVGTLCLKFAEIVEPEVSIFENNKYAVHVSSKKKKNGTEH